MSLFWIAAALLAAAAASLVLWTASRGRAAVGPAPERTLYLRQLQEVDEQRARGLLGEAEHRAARAEAGRRLLGAVDKAASPEAVPSRGGRMILLAAVAGAPLLALGLYGATGEGGRPDQPYAARLETWKTSDLTRLPPPALAAVAEDLTRRRPEDAQAWRVLGRARLAAGDAFGAVQALERAARVGGSAEDWAALGEAVAVSRGGAVGPDATAAFAEAVRLDPASVPGRYGLAQGRLTAGDLEGGRAALRALAASLPAEDERRAALEREAASLSAAEN